jgi:hypothetical protein
MSDEWRLQIKGATSADFLSNWQYRKSHLITSATDAGTNYQIKITVHYGSGSDSDDDVYLDSKSKTDFGDIRFTNNTGITELDYWMESKTDSDNAVFWVEVGNTLESNQTIYIYYGNGDVTTTSNGDNTFLFFEDFDNARFDDGFHEDIINTALVAYGEPTVSTYFEERWDLLSLPYRLWGG